MKVAIARTLLEQIMTQAAGCADEICGLLLGSPCRVEAICPAANVAADPSRHFELDPGTLFSAHRAARHGGPAVIGHYHSHPSGIARPSATDAACAAPDGSIWLIVGGGRARAWIATQGGGDAVQFVEARLDSL